MNQQNVLIISTCLKVLWKFIRQKLFLPRRKVVQTCLPCRILNGNLEFFFSKFGKNNFSNF